MTSVATPWAPPWAEWIVGELGQKEAAGDAENPRIGWYHGHTAAGPASEIVAWCSSFMNAATASCGIRGTRSKAADSWLTWGTASMLRVGAILVFGKADPDAKGTGHVGCCFGWTKTHVLCAGGNQSNAVSVAPRLRSTLAGVRWPVGISWP